MSGFVRRIQKLVLTRSRAHKVIVITVPPSDQATDIYVQLLKVERDQARLLVGAPAKVSIFRLEINPEHEAVDRLRQGGAEI